MIKGVVFDIGGVLACDIREYMFFEEGTGLISKFGLDKSVVVDVDPVIVGKYAYEKIGNPTNWKQIEIQYWDEIIKELGINTTAEELIKMSEKYIKPVNKMVELVKDLKEKGLDLLICSNNTEFWYQRINKALGLEDIFKKEKIILSNRFGASKSDPNFVLFNEVEKQMEYKKDEYLFIDDREGNIRRALEFGMMPVYFPAEADYGKEYLERIINSLLDAN